MENRKIPKLSFCITCKNRFHQIKETLSKNLEDNRMFQELIEFVLVDFGSTDGLKGWVSANFMEDIRSGYLKYYYTEELPNWHASIAKNTAHFLAQNDIVVNLDCDNFTGLNGGRFIIRQFLLNPGKIVIHQSSGDGYDGSYGRIATRRSQFIEIGGYDESFEPMTFQDDDLMYRLIANGAKYIAARDSRYNQAIRNTKEEGVIYANSQLSWREMLDLNRARSKDNIMKGKIIANNRIFGIRKNTYCIDEICL